jgi:V/A-type H+-transporting ATPase subunit C
LRQLLRDTGRADFGYGNARLRARRSGLLSREDYDGLLERDVDAILGALADTRYGPEVEAVLTRYHGAQRLHEAVRRHLARALEEMRSFYEGQARELVDVLLSRWDLHNVVTLMRGEATAPHTEAALVHVYPMGALSDALAREISRQNEFAAAVQLLVRWRLPDPETARGLREAWPEYERTEDLAVLEHAVTANWTARTAEALTGTGQTGAALRRFFERETDEKNLLLALRLREALRRGETDRLPVLEGYGVYLPGGSVEVERLDDAVRLPDANAVAGVLAAGHEGWRRPLERWASSGGLARLQHDLEARRVADAAGLFATGDPLGVEVPIAYAVSKETEARNLRLVAEGAARGLDPAGARARLVLFDGGEAA